MTLAGTAALQRRTLIVLVIMQVVGTVGVGVGPSIGVLLAEQVTDSEAWAGLARSCSTLGAALIGLPLGSFAARHGRRLALATGWWIAAAGAALLVVAAQFSLVVPLFIGLLAIGTGSAVSLQARFAATDLAEPHHRARSLSLVVWVGTVGSVLGPNLGIPGQAIGDATGLTVYAAAFLLGAVFLAVAGVIVFLLLRPDPLLTLDRLNGIVERPAGVGFGARIGAVFADIRSNPRARYAVIAIITVQIVMVSVMTMTPIHIEHEGGSIAIIGLTISLHVAGMYAFAPVVGYLVDKIGHRITVTIGIVVLVASLTIGITVPDDTTWIMVSLTLLGLGWSFINVSGSALFASVVSPESRATSQGGVDALSNLGAAVAAFGAGPLLSVGSFPLLSLIAMIVLAPLLALTMVPQRQGA